MKKILYLIPLFLVFALLNRSSAVAQDENPFQPNGVQTIVGPGISYQGRLEDASGPYNGTCDFQFELYGSYSGSDQIGSTLTVTGGTVSDGYFYISQLIFGSTAFNGDLRYLQVGVRCPAGSGDYATLSPRQLIQSVPYALSLPGLYTRQNTTSPNIIGGYNGNVMGGSVVGGTISGGGYDGGINQINESYGTIGGGAGNLISGWGATISGGITNTIDTNANYGVIGGGGYNYITGGWGSTISGGRGNSIEGDGVTIAGGSNNHSYAQDNSFIGGGWSNTTSGSFSTITGGVTNTIEITGTYAAIGGGQGNTVSGLAATIPGGANNAAAGDYSFAAGKNAQANHTGSFVWSDSRSDEAFESLRDYQFRIQAGGGTQFQDGDGNWIELLWGNMINTSSGAYLSPGGTWTNASDFALKENFAPVDKQAVLDELAGMPTGTWNYKAESESVRHIGPTAQDFYAAFGLGGTDKAISTVDADGISLAAIQGLYEITQDQAKTIETLEAENQSLENRISALESQNGAETQRFDLAPWLVCIALFLVLLARNKPGLEWFARTRNRTE